MFRWLNSGKMSACSQFSEIRTMPSKRKFINPYVEHGTKAENSKKITVSIPFSILKLLTDERTRRQVKNLRHGTNSELLCEAFLHAFTGQPLPTDEELDKSKEDYITSRIHRQLDSAS